MSFEVGERCLERLEWEEVAARLAQHGQTPRGKRRLAEGPWFARTPDEARSLLVGTREALNIVAEGAAAPLGGVREIEDLLARLRRDGLLAGSELLAIGATARACAETRRFLTRRDEEAPGLAALALALPDTAELASAVDEALESDGSVRDSASPALAAARREANEMAGRAQERIAKFLTDTNLSAALQDGYYTVRGDRYVLPVRADRKGAVPGIVHDASSSGTTLFIEPQAVVDLNNRLKQAELTVERETRRVLEGLSHRATLAGPDLASALALLEEIDLAFARAALALEMEAVEPVLDGGGVFHLDQLRHPLLPAAEVVPNDVRLGEGFHILVVSGPNAGGKTVAMKALALCALFARAGLFVPAAPGARVAAVTRVLAAIGDEQDLYESLSTFSAHMANLAEITASADEETLAVLDEVGVGTDPSEGAALAQAVLEALADSGARVVATTHYNLLKEMADVDPRFANASVEFDGETLAPTYRLRLGTAGSSSATAVAARMGMPQEVLERATSLLEREDRRLDRMLAELSASRVALERERSEAVRLRQESEESRDTYRTKLERLQERRDKLFEEMRSDLDTAFKEAHGEVAAVIRDLQRGGRAQDAAAARERLQALERQAESVSEAQRQRTPAAVPLRVDWQKAKPGDAVVLPGGRSARLLALPDRRGRVVVQHGSARLTVAAGDVTRPASGAAPTATRDRRPRVAVDSPPEAAARVDVRGLRAQEALDAVDRALDDATRRGAEQLEIVHGVGTGALLKAVREHLRALPFVSAIEPGTGSTTAKL